MSNPDPVKSTRRKALIVLAFFLLCSLGVWLAQPERSGDRNHAAEGGSTPGRTADLPTMGPGEVQDPVAGGLARPLEAPDPNPVDGGAIHAFSGWLDGYLKAAPDEWRNLEAEGVRLATGRRPWFKDLIRSDPKTALEQAVPMVVRQQLPPRILALLEERINEVGVLRVMHADPLPGEPLPAGSMDFHETELQSGKTYRAYVYGRRAEKATWTPGAFLNGVALDSDFAVSDEPSRTLEVGEVPNPAKPAVSACPVCDIIAPGAALQPGESVTAGTPAVETATEIVFFCEAAHIASYNETLLLGEGVSGGAFGFTGILPAAPTPALGIVKVLAIPMTYADQNAVPSTEATLYNTLRDVADFYAKSSYGRLTLVGAVSPPVKLAHNEAWYVNRDTSNGGDISGTSVEHAEARNLARSLGFDSNNYDCVVVRHNGGPGSYGGLGGGSSVWVRGDGAGLWAHEIGHCFGLGHSNFWDTAGTSSIGVGTNQEYGDIYDNMGSSGSYPLGHYNTQGKSQIKWLPPNFVEDAAQSGQYRIHAYDQAALLPSRRYALRIVKDAQKTYWGEVRSLFDTNPWAKNGMLLGWRYPGGSGGNLQRIDTTPGSPFGKDDAAISLGSTFSDTEAGIHLTAVAVNDSPRHVDVVVNFGQFPGNRKPTLALTASASTVPTGATVTFTAAADDPDGDALAYSWQHFGDTAVKLVSGNSPVITRTFGTAGTYVVTCTVSDMKGGSTTRNQIITVGSGNSRHTIRGRVTLLGQGLQDVVVTANGANGVVTDADGYYIIPNLAANTYTMTPLLYGYTFGELFNNSVTVGPSAAGADFEATATPVVAISASTPAAAEAGPVNGAFALTRTGDVSQPLTVNVNPAQGSATKGTDYSFAPDYAAGSQGFSTFTIPEGAATLEVTVIPVNDTIPEGPETVTLQLGPGNGYLADSASSATVVIDDDDTSLPKVSLAATTSSATEGSASPAVFTFSRTGATSGPLTINYTVSGTATSGSDYIPLSGSVVIPAGSGSAAVPVEPVDDALSEPLETVKLTMASDPAYLIDPLAASATVNLIDDDVQTVTLTASDPSAQEVDLTQPGAVADTGTFIVTRIGDTSGALTVYYSVTGTYNSGVAALHGVDYEALPGSIVIPAGATQAAVTILPRYDTIGEGPETVVLTLGAGPTNYILGTPSSATVTIADGASDVPYVEVVNTSSAAEPATNGTFRITCRGGTGTGSLTVHYTIGGTATAGADFTIPGLDSQTLTGTATVTLNNGATVIQNITVTPVNDGEAEDLESITLTIAPDAAYQTFAPTSAATMWLRDDEQPTVHVDTQVGTSGSVTFTEGATTAPVKFYVSRTGSTTSDLTVSYTTGGTATAGEDYEALSGSVTIPVGSRGADVHVAVINDTVFEGTETIAFDFAPGPYARGPGAVLYIADNETSTQRVGFAATGSAAPEGAGNVSIPVTLTSAATAPVTVEYLVDGGTAASTLSGPSTTNASLPYWVRATKSGTTLSAWVSMDGVDWFQVGSNVTMSNFTTTSPMAGIAAGSGTADQTCTAVLDNVSITSLAPGGSSGTETHLTVGTTNPAATSSNAAGVYTIGAGSPGIASGSTSDGFRYVYFPLSGTSSCSITARVVSISGGGTGSRAGVVIRAGNAANAIHFSTLVGGDIRANYTRRTAVGGTNSQSTVTPIVKPYWLRMERAGDLLRAYVSANGSAFTQVGGNQTIAMGPEVLAGLIVSARQDGQISEARFDSVSITPPPPGGVAFVRRSVGFVNETGAYEETGGVHTLSGSGAAIGASATDEGDLAGMRLTGDFVLTARVISQTGGANNAQAGLTIRENGDKNARMIYLGTTTNFGVEPIVRSRTRTTAFGGGVDFELAPGVLTFGIGEQTKQIVVGITDDNIVESDEVISVTLRNPNGAQLGTITVFNHTIVDDDSPSAVPHVGFAAASSTVLESAGEIRLPVTLSQPATGSGSVDYAVTGGTAVDPADFTLAAGTLDFGSGDSVKSIPVSIVQDSEVESAETVVVMLSNPVGFQFGSLDTHTLTLEDDDFPAVTIEATDASAAENGDPGTFTIARAGSLAGDLTVKFTRGGTATSGTDYAAIASPGSVIIPDRQASATVTVSPYQDTLNEGIETVILTLVADAAYTLGTPASATVTIADDDRSTLTIVATDADASETPGNPGQFTVTRTAPTTANLSVNLNRTGTATNTTDYATIGSSVTIPAGQASVAIDVVPVDDTLTEGPEEVILTINAGSYDIGDPGFASVTIADNDSPPTLFISSPTAQGPLVAYGNGVIVHATVTDDGSPDPVTLSWSAVAGPGTANIESPASETTAVTFDAPGTYVLRVEATDGQFTVSDQVTVAVGSGIMAADWITQDLGPSSARRGQGLPSGGYFSVTGTGAGYTGTSDQAHTMVRSVDGAASIVARLTNLQGSGTSLAGLTIRDAMMRGARRAVLGYLPGTGLQFRTRTTVSAADSVVTQPGVTLPVWLNLERNAATNEIAASYAPDAGGLPGAWTALGTPVAISMDSRALVGLTATSNSNTATATALFDNLTLTPEPTGSALLAEDYGTSPAAAGSGIEAAGTYTIAGSTSGYYYGWQYYGDLMITAKHADATSGAGSAKSGIRVAENLESGAYAHVGRIPQGAYNGYLWRSVAGGSGGGVPSFTAKVRWVRLVRRGNSITAYHAADSGGSPGTWAQLGQPQTVIMTTPVFVGFWVDNASGVGLNTVTFHSLSIEPLNRAPIVQAGMVAHGSVSPVALDGTVTDDNYPAPGSISTAWSQLSGPGLLGFGDASLLDTTAAFPVSGTYRLRLAAHDGSAETFAELSFTGVSDRYDAWKLVHFPGGFADPDAGPLLDPDGDGQPNLLEYATGGDPLQSSPPGVLGDLVTIEGESYLRISVTRNPEATDLSIEVQATGDLRDENSWSGEGLVIEVDTPMLLQVRDFVPVSSAHRRFMRVRIVR